MGESGCKFKKVFWDSKTFIGLIYYKPPSIPLISRLLVRIVSKALSSFIASLVSY